MRKQYPYLQDSWHETADKQLERQDFLAQLDDFVNQKRYAKLTLLNWAEEPLKEIQGEIVSGSLSKDGSSAVRRTCNLTTAVDAGSYTVEDTQMDFSLNKKIFLEIGIENKTKEYPEYPILWFPQGVFFIKSFACNSATSSAVNISLTLNDKMAMLNGDVGGKFPSATILDEEVTQLDTGEYSTRKVTLYRIIQEVVNHFGGEELNNIVIEDVPLRIKRIMRWTGDTPLYLVSNGGSAEAGTLSYIPQIEKPTSGAFLQINNGDDAGYVYDDFVYDTELTMNAGDSVVTALDKIKSYLGNFEYFYDVFGIFHFREIKNYLNTTQGKVLVSDMTEHDYMVETAIPKEVYTFSDKSNLLSINVNPQYENIKNDYIVHGLRKMTNSDIAYDIMYHLVIDTKPTPGNVYVDILVYKEPDTDIQKATVPTIVYDTLPEVGEFNTVYKLDDKAYFWSSDNAWKELEVVKFYNVANPYVTQDWRTELYMKGLLAQKNGTDKGYYFAELENYWPRIYDLVNQEFFGEQEDPELQARVLTEGDYFLDFIDSSTTLGKYSVNNIGRRADVVTDEDINCLFTPEIPNIVFLNLDLADSDPEGFEELRDECIDSGQPYAQTRGEIFNAFLTGGYHNGAYDRICSELYLHTTYQKTVSLTAIPNYYLEPNSRVRINDTVTNTFGSFMIQNISLPLDVGSVMSVTLNECTLQR